MTKIADDSPWHLTLREMQKNLFNIKFVIWMIAAIAVLTVAGPFGTLEVFNTLERLAYWLIVAPVTYIIASFSATFLVICFTRVGFGRWISYALAGLIAGLPVGIFVWLFQIILTEPFAFDLVLLLSIVVKTTLVTVPVTILFATINSKSDEENEGENTSASEHFFRRLPHNLGRDIMSLNAQDHYVEVRTTKGSELILMRLSDAINELSAIEGFQTHRSWWVAKKHAVNSRIIDGKRHVELTDGTKIPVSRTFAKSISI